MGPLKKKAVILLSGGLDSTTCMAMAKSQGYELYALSVHYGQKHGAELQAAQRVCDAMGAVEHRQVSVDVGAFGGSSLTDPNMKIPEKPESGIPSTYVPARNTMLLSFALGWAEILGAEAIFVGVNAVDYSGYPDCRPEYINAFQVMADLATKAGIQGRGPRIETPLLAMTKAQIIQAGCELGVDYSMTVTCYQATEDGLACGLCDACRLRNQGFREAGVADVTGYVDLTR